MPVFRLGDELVFPPVELAEDGLLAVGGDLSPERLELAYSQGIFPWYSDGEPILWHSPDPRFILTPDRLRVPRSLRRTLRARPYSLTMDTAFEEVVRRCAVAPRPDEAGTWITAEMQAAYVALHRRGIAHSVEAWDADELVGGLYGVALGTAFCGESMFADAPDASKVAFVTLVGQLERWAFGLIDCQVYTEHLERFGATPWPRTRYIDALRTAVSSASRPGPWQFDS